MRIRHERGADQYEVTIGDSDTTSDEILVQSDWQLSVSGVWDDGKVGVEQYNVDTAAWEEIRSYNVKKRAPSGSGFQDEITRMRITETSTSGTDNSATLECADGEPFGEVEITGWTSATSMTAVVKKRLYSTDATSLWQKGAFSASTGYPAAAVFHEGRLLYGGTASLPQTIWGSASDDFAKFRDGQDDASSWRHTLRSNEYNAIRWMISERRLIIGTAGGEFVMGQSGEGSQITFSSVRANRHSAFGSAKLAGVFVNDSVIYAQHNGRKLREYGYIFERDRYVAAELTTLSEHITGTGIRNLCHQKERDVILWTTNREGELLGLTYEKEQDVIGWHRHVTQNGEFEDVQTMYGDGPEDEVWMLTKRTVNGVERRMIERFSRNQFDAQRDGDKSLYHMMDSGLRVTGTDLTSIDLPHLDGEEVLLSADGIQQPRVTVISGVASLPAGVTADSIVGGLPMRSAMQLLKLDVGLGNGTARTREGRINRLGISLWQSMGGVIGETADGDEFDPLIYRTTDDVLDDSPDVRTGEFEFDCDFDFREAVTVAMVNDSVYPMMILMLVPKMEFFGDNTQKPRRR